MGIYNINPVKGLEETKLQVPSIKEIRELIQKAKVLNLSKKFKKYYRPAPLPAMSPFVPDVPIVRQTLTKPKSMSAKVVKEIHKAGL